MKIPSLKVPCSKHKLGRGEAADAYACPLLEERQNNLPKSAAQVNPLRLCLLSLSLIYLKGMNAMKRGQDANNKINLLKPWPPAVSRNVAD